MADWSKLTSRGSVEDRRSMPIVGGISGLGLVGTLIALAFTFFSSNGDIGAVLNQLQNITTTQQNLQSTDFQGSSDYPVFASTVLGSTNDFWGQVFNQNGKTYNPPKLVLFRQATQSACGGATSDVGPHYCPLDATIYLDETFFDELHNHLKAQGGDVAEAYVIAHEVGHHVQTQLGITDAYKQSSNQESVRIELQADCFAGVWAHSIANLNVFGPGEINEATDAAAAVGDDRIQKAVTGQINPETWTHGSSTERVQWFNQGFNTGEPAQCDTFKS